MINKIIIVIVLVLLIIYFISLIRRLTKKVNQLQAGKKWEGVVEELRKRK